MILKMTPGLYLNHHQNNLFRNAFVSCKFHVLQGVILSDLYRRLYLGGGALRFRVGTDVRP